MKITRRSPMTGEVNVLEIDVTAEQITKWQDGIHIQEAMPNITADEREFILTGLTANDWVAMFGEKEEED